MARFASGSLTLIDVSVSLVMVPSSARLALIPSRFSTSSFPIRSTSHSVISSLVDGSLIPPLLAVACSLASKAGPGFTSLLLAGSSGLAHP